LAIWRAEPNAFSTGILTLSVAPETNSITSVRPLKQIGSGEIGMVELSQHFGSPFKPHQSIGVV